MSEVLLDDTRRYAEKARAAGVQAVAHVWEGMTHVFPSSVGTLEAAEKALGLMATFLDERFGPRPELDEEMAVAPKYRTELLTP